MTLEILKSIILNNAIDGVNVVAYNIEKDMLTGVVDITLKLKLNLVEQKWPKLEQHD